MTASSRHDYRDGGARVGLLADCSSRLCKRVDLEVTIPAGQASVTVTLTPIFHAGQEARRQRPSRPRHVGDSDDADEPAVTIAVGDATAAELGNDTGSLR